MKSIGTAYCLAAIISSMVFGLGGSVLFCKHDSGSAHFVSKVEHAIEVHGDSCHAHKDPAPNSSRATCDSCIDTEIAAPDTANDASPSLERAILKAPALIGLLPANSILVRARLTLSHGSLPQQGPSALSAAAFHFADTVQFLI